MEIITVVKHIRVRRMWHYVHLKAELTADELVHVSDCQLCLKLFKICALAETPSVLDKELEEEERQKKSA